MTINTINFNTPFLIGIPNSRISPEWIRLFGAIIDTVGGSNITSDEFQEYFFTSRIEQSDTVPAIQFDTLATISTLRTANRDLARRLEELEARIYQRAALPSLLMSDDLAGSPRSMTSASANTVAVMDDISSNLTMYPIWANGIAGLRQAWTSSTKMTFNPSTGTLTMAGALTAYGATAIPAGGTAGVGFLLSSTSNFGVFFGSGAPTLSAAKGSLFLRSDGTTTNNRMYVNTNGSTTWTAVTTVA